MRQRVLTGIAFFVAVAAFVLPSIKWPIFMLLFSIVVGAVSFYEMTKALKTGGLTPTVPMFAIASIASVDILIIAYWRGLSMMTSLACYVLIVLMLAFAAVVIPSVVRPDGNHLMDGLVTAATLLYITFPLFCILWLIFRALSSVSIRSCPTSVPRRHGKAVSAVLSDVR